MLTESNVAEWSEDGRQFLEFFLTQPIYQWTNGPNQAKEQCFQKAIIDNYRTYPLSSGNNTIFLGKKTIMNILIKIKTMKKKNLRQKL